MDVSMRCSYQGRAYALGQRCLADAAGTDDADQSARVGLEPSRQVVHIDVASDQAKTLPQIAK